MSNQLNIALIGVGERGLNFLKSVLFRIEGIRVTAICDLYADHLCEAIEIIQKHQKYAVNSYTDHMALLNGEKLDAVIIATTWDSHISIAIDAMNAKIPVGLEVGGAYSIEECIELVSVYEKTRTPFMFLENCCFDKTELMATFMARDNLFGDIVYCSGAYSHDLRKEIAGGNKTRNFRLNNHLNRNCEYYPTHELGPIAKILDINRGNRMLSLVSVSSKASGMENYIADKGIKDPYLEGKKFKQGDIINTLITCAGGQTISLILDTTLPGLYDRAILIKGTKGMYNQSCNYAVLDREPVNDYSSGIGNNLKLINSAVKYEKEYLPDYWKSITEEQKAAGHGGMDEYMLKEFFNVIRRGGDMPIDVYDAAAWMSVSCLSEQSIALGNKPVPIPDFTKGKWLIRERRDVVNL